MNEGTTKGHFKGQRRDIRDTNRRTDTDTPLKGCPVPSLVSSEMSHGDEKPTASDRLARIRSRLPATWRLGAELELPDPLPDEQDHDDGTETFDDPPPEAA